MTGFSYKEKDRYFVSFIFAVILHIIIFAGLHFILNIRIEVSPEYTGPLYLEIGPEFTREVVPEDTDKNKEEEKVDEDNKHETVGEVKYDNDIRRDEQIKDDTGSALAEKEYPEEKNDSPEEAVPEVNPVKDRGDSKEEDAVDHTTDTSHDVDNPDQGDNTSIEKSPPATPEPTLTPTPYDPAIKEENLVQLDKLLENGLSGDKDSPDDTKNDKAHTEGSDTNFTEGGGPLIEWEDNRDRNPLITYEPDIPDWVSREGKEMIVEVSFLLTQDGFLTSLRIVKSSGYTDVDSVIVEALRKWKFPSVSGTASVSGRITYIIGLK